tara:strand:+ start:124 stop:366 length:243 start_codon:yes stop_codon:yes gene_type:complete
MFNKKGESQMDKTILVVEVSKYSWGTSYSVKKHASSLDKASEYLVSLKHLNDNDRITYELFNRFGQFEVDKIEKVANDNK